MTPANHAGIVAATGKKSIDPVQLQHLEQSFRTWANSPSGINRKASRKRVLLIFLLIRYTGARLNEILSLHPVNDIDLQNRSVQFHKGDMKKSGIREVQ